MTKLSMAQRKALPPSKFLVPSKAPGPGSFPVPDASHVNAAISMAGGARGAPKRPAVQAKARAMKKGK